MGWLPFLRGGCSRKLRCARAPRRTGRNSESKNSSLRAFVPEIPVLRAFRRVESDPRARDSSSIQSGACAKAHSNLVCPRQQRGAGINNELKPGCPRQQRNRDNTVITGWLAGARKVSMSSPVHLRALAERRALERFLSGRTSAWRGVRFFFWRPLSVVQTVVVHDCLRTSAGFGVCSAFKGFNSGSFRCRKRLNSILWIRVCVACGLMGRARRTARGGGRLLRRPSAAPAGGGREGEGGAGGGAGCRRRGGARRHSTRAGREGVGRFGHGEPAAAASARAAARGRRGRHARRAQRPRQPPVPSRRRARRVRARAMDRVRAPERARREAARRARAKPRSPVRARRPAHLHAC